MDEDTTIDVIFLVKRKDGKGKETHEKQQFIFEEGTSFIQMKRVVEKQFDIGVNHFIVKSEGADSGYSIDNNPCWQGFVEDWVEQREERYVEANEFEANKIAEKLVSTDPNVRKEGICSLWEMSMKKENLIYLSDESLDSFFKTVLAPGLDENLTASAGTLWSLCASRHVVKKFVRLGAMEMLINLVNTAKDINCYFAGSLAAVGARGKHLLKSLSTADGIQAVFKVVQITINGMWQAKIARKARRASVVLGGSSEGMDKMEDSASLNELTSIQVFGAALLVISKIMDAEKGMELMLQSITDLHIKLMRNMTLALEIIASYGQIPDELKAESLKHELGRKGDATFRRNKHAKHRSNDPAPGIETVRVISTCAAHALGLVVLATGDPGMKTVSVESIE
jgi:hypothetical protein